MLGARVLGRFLATAHGERIAPCDEAPPPEDRVAVIVPVLDEHNRLAPCLDGLIAQGPEVATILVVDGGSVDGTPDLVARYGVRDRRVRLIDAGPKPDDWNGKAWNLHVGAAQVGTDVSWILTVDADVRPAPLLVRSLLAHARRTGLAAFSVATHQEVSGAGEALLHPALLTTLVYRFGLPGGATRRVGAVQANGQCFLVRRDVLCRSDAISLARASRCEDVTIARRLAVLGWAVGFYEAGDLAWVTMYRNGRELWHNWPRSLPLRDQYAGPSLALGLAEVALVQALPLPLVAAFLLLRRMRRAGVRGPAASRQRHLLGPVNSRRQCPGARASRPLAVAGETPALPDASQTLLRPDAHGAGCPLPRPSAEQLYRWILALNLVLVLTRLGVLFGTARAYRRVVWSYWLSPLCDVPAALQLCRSALRRRHTWRGRVLVLGGTR